MNLHGLAGPVIAAVNPQMPATLQVSVGPGARAVDGTYPALVYATPGSITASIGGLVLTVSAIASGTLQAGQALADITAALLPGTVITGQLTGSAGGIGTYSVNQTQTVASEAMTTSRPVIAQVQPLTWRDLQQLDGLNLQGTRRKIYLYGRADGAVRPLAKGGDLITIATGGVNDGIYLVAQVLEQFPDWVSVAATLQNNS